MQILLGISIIVGIVGMVINGVGTGKQVDSSNKSLDEQKKSLELEKQHEDFVFRINNAQAVANSFTMPTK
jgi:hypothetical protein